MRITVHHIHTFEDATFSEHILRDWRADRDAVHRKLDRILSALTVQGGRMAHIAEEVQRLIEEVDEQTTVNQSAAVMISGLRDQITQLAAEVVDPATKAKLNELATSLDTNNQALQNAMVAHTPAAPAAPPSA